MWFFRKANASLYSQTMQIQVGINSMLFDM